MAKFANRLLDSKLAVVPGRKQYAMVTGSTGITLGGKDQRANVFEPEIFCERPDWGPDAYWRMRHPDADRAKAADRVSEINDGKRDGVRIAVGKRIHQFFEGSVEWTVTYTEQSDIPAVENFYLDYPLDQLTWHKQLALTAEEVTEGHVRPENVVNSYAIYWPQAGRIMAPDGSEVVNWATGKFCHIYRPYWLAGDGAVLAWDMHRDGNLLCIEKPPQMWLDAHSGPWTLDPNLGFDQEGGTYFLQDRNYVSAYSVAAGSNGTASKLWVFTHASASGNCKVALYDAGFAGARLSSSYEFTSPTLDDWNDVDISGDTISISSGTSYYPSVVMTAAEGHGIVYDSGSSGDVSGYTSSVTYASEMADPSNTATTTLAVKISLYLEYTESGGGNAMPMAIHHYKMAGGL